MRQVVACAGLFAFSVSCSPAAPLPETPAPSPETIAPPNAVPAAAPSSGLSAKEQALQDKLASALAYVSEIRQLAAKSPVQGRLISKTEVERFVAQEIDAETPKDVLAATEALLDGLGLVPPGFDYRASVIDLMTSQLLGFYDPKRKTFFVGGDLSGDEADVTLWHELVHALQDQHYDLSHLTEWQPDRGDSQSAVHGLAEGDATSAMLDALLKPRGSTALEVPESLMQAQTVLGSAALSAPPVLVRSLLAPYVDGLAFTNYLRRRGGFAMVDQAWGAPPVSTEQLLHPEKFLAQEPPQVVAIPTPPPGGLQERFHDVMGEQTLRLFFEEWLPARTAATSATDWGGDRLAAYSDEDRRLWAIGWHIRFDSAAAAERAFIAFGRAAPLTERVPGAQPSDLGQVKKRGDKLCRDRNNQGPLALVRRGADLAVTVGPFQRNGVAVSPDPDCATALAWAQQIVKG
jgi:hypothetical protein